MSATPTGSPGRSGSAMGGAPWARSRCTRGREHETRAVERGECTGRDRARQSADAQGQRDGTKGPGVSRRKRRALHAVRPGERHERPGGTERGGEGVGERRRAAAPIGIGAIRGPGAPAPRVVASTISPIGVMPAMGSVANEPSAYDTAPIIRPSTYTGLPLMPAMTPVLASGPPLSLAMIRSRCGPTFERTTPRIVRLELLDRRPLEDRAAHAGHARLHLFDRHVAGGRRRRERQEGPAQDDGGELSEVHLSPL